MTSLDNRTALAAWDRRVSALLEAVVVLVPAYQPGWALVDSVQELAAAGIARIVVVDDGSTQGVEVFEQLRRVPGCEVIAHAVNLGKGRALKTGFNHICLHYPECRSVVTADADGQHQVADIVRVALEALPHSSAVTIGARSFSAGVPLRSLVGNIVSRHVLRATTGLNMTDTQSGLRAIPVGLLPRLIRLDGERYEYEMNMLLSLREAGVGLRETPIATIYLDGNRSSHFSPVFDSMKIHFVLLRYAMTSLCTSGIDQVLFFAAWQAGLPVAAAMAAARLGASIFNLGMNRQFVFKSSARLARILIRYYGLIAFTGCVAYGLIGFLNESLGVPVPAAKILVETGLFLVSFAINRDFVFATAERS